MEKDEKKKHVSSEKEEAVACSEREANNGIKNENAEENGGMEPRDADAPAGNELEAIKAQLDEKSSKCEEYFSMLQRTAAEFDNYKKRTVKEKEALYSDAVCDVVVSFLPVIDSIERALQLCSGKENEQSINEGIGLVDRQIKDVLKKLGVEEIKSVGETFDPNIHNAVMHVEDEAYGHNVIVEEFQKGYIYKERVIRHSMVKVAN
jgi:molecular chaperone GrpE